jgi:hypothetical protein
MNRSPRRILAGLLITLVIACPSPTGPEARLAEAQRRWISSGLQDYSWVVFQDALGDAPSVSLVDGLDQKEYTTRSGRAADGEVDGVGLRPRQCPDAAARYGCQVERPEPRRSTY